MIAKTPYEWRKWIQIRAGDRFEIGPILLKIDPHVVEFLVIDRQNLDQGQIGFELSCDLLEDPFFSIIGYLEQEFASKRFRGSEEVPLKEISKVGSSIPRIARATVFRTPLTNTFDLYMHWRDEPGRINVVNFGDTTISSRDDNDFSARPADPLKLPEEIWQQIMDDLWHIGLRPTNVVASEGVKEAMQDHIKSLQDVTGRVLSVHTTVVSMLSRKIGDNS